VSDLLNVLDHLEASRLPTEREQRELVPLASYT